LYHQYSLLTAGKKISGDFPVKLKIERFSGEISGDFPVMQRKIPHFHVFRSNRRISSAYLGNF
jgi:hypothetical protein